MPSQQHTVFDVLVEKYHESIIGPVTDAETVQDDEGNVPIVRGRVSLVDGT
jgi:hypothetical protein